MLTAAPAASFPAAAAVRRVTGQPKDPSSTSLTSQKVLLTGAFSILDTSQTKPWQAAVAMSPSVTARTRRGLRAVPAAQARGLSGQLLLAPEECNLPVTVENYRRV